VELLPEPFQDIYYGCDKRTTIEGTFGEEIDEYRGSVQ
jgi:hypothetical protein